MANLLGDCTLDIKIDRIKVKFNKLLDVIPRPLGWVIGAAFVASLSHSCISTSHPHPAKQSSMSYSQRNVVGNLAGVYLPDNAIPDTSAFEVAGIPPAKWTSLFPPNQKISVEIADPYRSHNAQTEDLEKIYKKFLKEPKLQLNSQ